MAVAANLATATRVAEARALQQKIAQTKRLLAIKEAQDSLLSFTQLTMPDPNDPDVSLYEIATHHKLIAGALEKAERHIWPRLIICMPPRHGKSELVSRRFPAWVLGRDPTRQVIMATYNEEFARDFGRDVRAIMRDPVYLEIFPRATLRKGGAAADRLNLVKGGKMMFAGRGGALTGRGGHFLLLDDPFKDAEEADSPAIREKAWNWFTKVFYTRRMNVSSLIIVMTRWHEDDIVGRLTDPGNPSYDETVSKGFRILELPFFAEESDPMGRKPGEVLWPSRYPAEFGDEQRRLDARGFSALYQQKPSPDDGVLFKREDVRWYQPNELPSLSDLTIYAASDHAVATDQVNDRTCMLIVGVDKDQTMWLLDCWWKRAAPEAIVEAWLRLIQRWHPSIWWAEKGHISKSIGPFLRRRMMEESTFCKIAEVTPAGDKVQRSNSFQGRFSMGLVRFPKSASWANEAVDELMKFPHARFDDFVDTTSLIGLGLGTISGRGKRFRKPEPKAGTFSWIKAQTKYMEQRRLLESGGTLGDF